MLSPADRVPVDEGAVSAPPPTPGRVVVETAIALSCASTSSCWLVMSGFSRSTMSSSRTSLGVVSLESLSPPPPPPPPSRELSSSMLLITLAVRALALIVTITAHYLSRSARFCCAWASLRAAGATENTRTRTVVLKAFLLSRKLSLSYPWNDAVKARARE